ncbi:MAG: putative toxin-antitoxin system toxin component, PIN family [Spirochaetes bacterium]|nr:putative toxin-antitoxin system toxin component, PIN family [Spirochaetota bacterium]
MKAVIDTNVFVSSFFGGNPKKITDLWLQGKITLCLSRPVMDEYIDVLQRMGLGHDRELEELIALFGSGYNILFTSKTPSLQVVEKDPHDDKFIECAVALKAGVIITGDTALRSVRKYNGISILSPAEFLKAFPSLSST